MPFAKPAISDFCANPACFLPLKSLKYFFLNELFSSREPKAHVGANSILMTLAPVGRQHFQTSPINKNL